MVLDTDYDNYAVIYGCDDYFFGLLHNEQAWLLNRERNSANQATYKQTASDTFTAKVPGYDWDGLKADTIHTDD